MANLAPMLPSAPKSFGRLSEAYLSAFLAVQGQQNPLGLTTKNSYGLVLVDGLGVSNIEFAGAHAGFLNQSLKSSRSLYSGFPSTTSTSLTSLATGKSNGDHGFIGYRVFDRKRSISINLLNDLGEELPPRQFQDLETISEKAKSSGLRVVTIGPAEYANSGFTEATMPQADYIPASSFEDRFKKLLRELENPKTLAYMYTPELDQVAHRFGCQSNKWLQVVEEFDSALARYSRKIPTASSIVLTADHGVIDVNASDHVYLDEFDSVADVIMVGGDPRSAFLYFPDGCDLKQKLFVLVEQLGNVAYVTGFEELQECGWVTALSETAKKLQPDFVLIAKGSRALYDRRFAKPKSLEMIGQHGGFSKQEWEVPLLVFS